MKTSKNKGNGKLTAEQVSTRVLYTLVALTVVVFGVFSLIGYNEPYAEDPSFNAPVLTDAVLVFIYMLVFVASALAVGAVVVSVRRRDESSAVINNVPTARISRVVRGLLCLTLVATYGFGSSEPVLANGVEFTDRFWLKATDMFINTSFVLLIVAVCGVIFGLSGYNRKVKLK